MDKNPLWIKKKNSLIMQKQRICTEAKKKQRFSLLFAPTGDVHLLPRKQGFNICSGCSWRLTETQKNKCPLLFSSFLLVFMAEQTSYGLEYPCRQCELAVLAMPSSKVLPTPAYHWGWSVGEAALMVPALLSRHQSTGVRSAPFQLPMQNTALPWGKLPPSH